MFNKKKITLLSFATSDLSRSVERFKKQAKESNYYDQILIMSPDDLKEKDKQKLNFLLQKGKKRGYGYWFWKPLLLISFLEKMEKESIAHYMDIGFHINKTSSNRFYEYLELLNQNNRWLLAFQYKPIERKMYSKFRFPEREEFKYTKADLFSYYQRLEDKKITHTPQFSAGNFFIKKNEKTEQFIYKWLEVFEKRFDLIDDTPSKIKNFTNFIENRHDQSVFSILCKINSIESLSAYEFDWAEKENKRTWEHIHNFPFFARRDLEYNFFKRFINRQIKNFKRNFLF
jgi:hypothetical protein